MFSLIKVFLLLNDDNNPLWSSTVGFNLKRERDLLYHQHNTARVKEPERTHFSKLHTVNQTGQNLTFLYTSSWCTRRAYLQLSSNCVAMLTLQKAEVSGSGFKISRGIHVFLAERIRHITKYRSKSMALCRYCTNPSEHASKALHAVDLSLCSLCLIKGLYLCLWFGFKGLQYSATSAGLCRTLQSFDTCVQPTYSVSQRLPGPPLEMGSGMLFLSQSSVWCRLCSESVVYVTECTEVHDIIDMLGLQHKLPW